MLEMLNNALIECEAEKRIIAETDDEQAIQEELAKFEAELRRGYAEKKQAVLTDYDYQIKALNNLIAREKARLASVEQAKTVEAESVATTDNADGNLQG